MPSSIGPAAVPATAAPDRDGDRGRRASGVAAGRARVTARTRRWSLGLTAAFVVAVCGTHASTGEAEPRTAAELDAGSAAVKRADGGARITGIAPNGHLGVPDLEDVEHMCALLTSCEKLPLPSGMIPKDFASCVRTMYAELASPAAAGFSLTLRDCGLRASSCGELRSCALRGVRPDICAGRGKTTPVDLCDSEGRAVTCSGERVAVVRDCPRGGEQCVVRDGKAACALGSCGADSPPACSANGARILECKKGKLSSLDCGAFGLRCVTNADGPQCASQGAACPEGSLRCEGSTAVGCWHNHEVRVDCGSSGLSCSAGSAPSASTVGACTMAAPSTDACDASTPARCDGATLKYCAWGTPRSYLCKSMGLSRCVVEGNKASCR